MNGPLVRQTARNLFPVQGLHPVEMLRREACLVALERADEVPFELQIAQGVDLRQRVLHVILAERLLPRSGCFPDALHAVALGNCQQSHCTGAAGALARFPYARFHTLQVS